MGIFSIGKIIPVRNQYLTPAYNYNAQSAINNIVSHLLKKRNIGK